MNQDQELIDRSRRLAHEAGASPGGSMETMRLVTTILALASALEESNRRGTRAEAAIHKLAKALEEKHEPEHRRP